MWYFLHLIVTRIVSYRIGSNKGDDRTRTDASSIKRLVTFGVEHANESTVA